jgi:hypothetical protein
MDETTLFTLMLDLINCVKKFYPSTTSSSRFDVMVCISEGNKKTGIHPIFPNLIVNVNQAIDIRNYYVNHLCSKYGDMVGIQNSWEDVVDMSVYGANGLRMVGSHKTEDCSECKGQRKKRGKKSSDSYSPVKDKCLNCGGVGKIDTGKIYMPKIYIRDEKIYQPWVNILSQPKCLSEILIDETTGHKKYVISLCSIRCPLVNESSSDFAITDEEMVKLIRFKNRNHDHRNNNNNNKTPQSPREKIFKQVDTEYGTYRMTEEDYKGMNKFKQRQFIPNNSEQFQMVQEFINSKSFPKQWRSLIIHNMFTNPKKTYYIVNVRGDGQHFCLNNRNDNHKSNSIYFFIEHNSIHQRCYCSCQTTENRRNGKCEDFASEKFPLVSKLDKLLFPVLQGKAGHFQSERAFSTSDMDDYTLRVATVISKIDDGIKEYLEEREQRLKYKKEEEIKPKTIEIIEEKPLKRKRKKQPQP